jgi:uncharacterized membrane protein
MTASFFVEYIFIFKISSHCVQQSKHKQFLNVLPNFSVEIQYVLVVMCVTL